jgi:hypothetical protein
LIIVELAALFISPPRWALKHEQEIMPDENLTLTTQQTQEQQPATPPTEPAPPAEALNTDTAVQDVMIPKSRFDEINKRLKAMELEATKATKAQQESERKALEEQSRFKELYEKEKAEREAALAEMSRLQLMNMRREVAAETKLPLELANRLIGNTREELEADAKTLLASLPKAAVPSLDGRAGGGKAGKPDITDAQIREQAARLNVSYENLKAHYGV